MGKTTLAESSIKSGALTKENIPGKLVVSDVWQNEKLTPPQQGTRLESADGPGDTLIGRLSARMASRDLIDEVNLGPKGKLREAKEATIADSGLQKKLHIGGMGRHQQTMDMKAFNSSDPTPDKGSRKGNTMKDQAKNAGNVINVDYKKLGKTESADHLKKGDTKDLDGVKVRVDEVLDKGYKVKELTKK